jgi:hypothetical protein
VIGGGPNGLRGLDPARIFGGWVNNELDAATPATRPNASGEDVVSEYLDTTGAAPATHSRISVWVNTATKFFVPGGTPPVLVPGPVLDVSPFGNEGRGGNRAVGTEGAIGPPSLVKTPVAATATDPGGQTWQILMFDSPGDSCPPVLTSLPGTLASYRFNLDFQSDLVVWTNVRGVPDPTPGPIQPGSAAPDAACCLYSSVQTNTWNIRFAIAFVPATGAVVGGVPTINVTLTKDASATRRARPVGAALETRAPPTALSLLGVQERT